MRMPDLEDDRESLCLFHQAWVGAIQRPVVTPQLRGGVCHRSALVCAILTLLVAGCSAGSQDGNAYQAAAASTVPAAPVLGWTPKYQSLSFSPPSRPLPDGPRGDVRDFGAKCDGITDDRAAIQAALDARVVIQFPAGGTCVVNARGLSVNVVNTPHRYALSIPSYRLLYLNGSTLKLGDGQNAHLFINSDVGQGGNHDIAILGPGTFDLNKAGQTSPPTGEQSGGLMDLVTDLTLRDITFVHVREYALRHFRINRGYYDNLVCTDSDGSCFAFGIAGVGGPSGCYFGSIEGHNAAGFSSPGAQGNPFISYGSDNVLYSFIGSGNRFGFKLQDGASNWTIGRIEIRGSSADKGVKIMGTRDGAQTQRLTIGEIVTSDNYYEGLYIWESDDLEIRQVTSSGDAVGAASPAVTLAPTANRVAVKSMAVQTSKGGGVSIEGTDVDIQDIYARNNGSQLAGQANVAIHDGGQRVRIGSLITVDDRSPPMVAYGLAVHKGANNVDVWSFLPLGSFVEGLLRNEGTNVRITDYRQVIKLFADGDTSPSVLNGTLFETDNSRSTTITNFEDGVLSQEISVLCGDSNTELLSTAALQLSAPMACTTGNLIRLMFDGGKWYETGRTAL